MDRIQMVDMKGQLSHIRSEVNKGIAEVLDTCIFIQGPQVSLFEEKLKKYHRCKHAISCANGTDALQIALMALDLKPGDEVIVPAFTYVATAEVIGLLGLIPIMIDVDPKTYNIDVAQIVNRITKRTKVIVPVHLYGQLADMTAIMDIAADHNLFVIEDNAQGIGAQRLSDGAKSGTIAHIGCTSFFPSKNLGCFGDGGAITTNDDDLGQRIKMIANHGQRKKYYHSMLGVNSRLDAIQAAVLNVKIDHLDSYIEKRQAAAAYYDDQFNDVESITPPHRSDYSSHVYNQYTIKVADGRRDELKVFLQEQGIPSMIYYPLPLYKQEAYQAYWRSGRQLSVTEQLCDEVLSLPMHTELSEDQLDYIMSCVKSFFS